MKLIEKIRDHLGKTAYGISAVEADEIMRVAEIMLGVKKIGRRVWLVGNGGSAATAMHFANDLRKMAGMDVVCLPSEIPTILAYGNDDGWENMFSNAMSTFKNGDLLVAISYSGRSKNVISAANVCIGRLGFLVVLTGKQEGNILTEPPVDAEIFVETDDITVAEDIHMAICHAIIKALIDVEM